MRQVELRWRQWGGKRRGSGRKPKGERATVSHRRRAAVKERFPVHVTWRVEPHVWNLRSRRCFAILSRALYAASAKMRAFKIVHFSVMGNHLHLLVEAHDERSLSRGMRGLGIRIARGLNRLMQRRGRVLADRYHAHILRTPTEVQRARNYLLSNARKHYGYLHADPFASTIPVTPPSTFLLRRVCESRQGLELHSTS